MIAAIYARKSSWHGGMPDGEPHPVKVSLVGGLIVCLFLFLPLPAFATTIFATLGEKTITIAADGVAVGNPTKSGSIIGKADCKILCKDLICFAAAGRLDAKAKSNVFRLAQQELEKVGTPKEASNRLRTTMAPLLSAMFAAEKQESPDRYKMYIEGVPMLSYFFAGFSEDGTPVIIKSTATINAKGNVLPLDESIRKGEVGIIHSLALGRQAYIRDYKKNNQMWVSSAAQDPTAFVESMVRLEIQASEMDGTREVGEPISIMSLTKAEGHFKAERAGNCQTNHP